MTSGVGRVWAGEPGNCEVPGTTPGATRSDSLPDAPTPSRHGSIIQKNAKAQSSSTLLLHLVRHLLTSSWDAVGQLRREHRA